MTGGEIAIGSRGSPLALAQARLVQNALARAGQASRIEIIETEGDRRAPDTPWGEGAFVAAIERSLLAGRVDVAVHSAKDVPTDQDPRLRIAAYLPRADPRDALVVRADASERRLGDLPPGTRIGTDSPRRAGFLLARRSDLRVHPLHGNVDTRLRRLEAGETDALVLASAGLDRIDLGSRIAERIEPETVPPAPGQGAIAVQVRGDDARMLATAAGIDDRPTRQAVETERAFLAASGGGCRSPIGALATIVGDELELLGGWASLDGAHATIARRRGPVETGEDLARELAADLGWRSGDRTAAAHHSPGERHPIRPRVLVTRAADQAVELMSALRAAGLDPVPVPAIAIESEPRDGELDAAVRRLPTFRWVVITSANGARAILEAIERVRPGSLATDGAAPSWAAIGSATRRVLEDEGIDVEFEPSQSIGVALAAELPVTEGVRVLVVRGDLGDGRLPASLRARGADVEEVVGYRTHEAPERSRGLLRKALSDGPIAAAIFTSGSTVRGLVGLGRAESIDVHSVPAVCIGPETAEEARAAGFQVIAVSSTPGPAALADATSQALAWQTQETA